MRNIGVEFPRRIFGHVNDVFRICRNCDRRTKRRNREVTGKKILLGLVVDDCSQRVAREDSRQESSVGCHQGHFGRMNLQIRSVQLDDERDVRAAEAQFAGTGFDWSTVPPNLDTTWAEYVALLRDWELGENLPNGWVPVTTRLAVVDGSVAGRLSVRHELNEFLALVGGHIGYGVREPYRRHGIATQLLTEGLGILRDLGLREVLVTCKEDNVGSATVIERGGGKLRDRTTHPVTGEVMRRYDIFL